MTNAITKLQDGTIEMSDLELLIMEEATQDDHAYDFVASRIKMPSGGAKFFDLDGDAVKEFTAIVALSQRARAWWPGDGTGTPPLCSSADARQGWIQSDPSIEQLQDADNYPTSHPGVGKEVEIGPHDCGRCPLGQFGSDAKGGRGQACKLLNRIVLLVDGYTMPVLMTLPPTSIRDWDRYCSGLANRKSAYFAVKTKFGLEMKKSISGVDYAVCRFSLVDAIEERDQLLAVKDIRDEYRRLIGDMPIDATEYETTDTPPPPPASDIEMEAPF